MTAQPIQPAPEQSQATAPPVVVAPPRESRLAALHAQYADAKAEADAAAERLKAVTDGIKAELRETAPGQDRLELRSAYGPALSLVRSTPTRFDSKRFRAAIVASGNASLVALYEQYTTTGESWTLKAVSA